MTKKETIAVHVPRWLYRHDVGITIFVRGLYRSIKNSDKYKLLKISPFMCSFGSVEEAKAFVQKHNISLVIYHGSRIILTNKKKEKSLNYLEACVPFLNSGKVHIADDKLETKSVLKKIGIPVLEDVIVKNKKELLDAMVVDKLYVAKPHDAESGRGVKLIKKTNTKVLEYFNSAWRDVNIEDTRYGLKLFGSIGARLFVIMGIFVVSTFCLLLVLFQSFIYILLIIWFVAISVHIFPKIHHDFIYKPLMLEPFFGDNLDEFYCLRCTVIGNKVVEAAKKANKRNVTPNISHGGKASKVTLTKEQEEMAIAATKAVGAIYAGIDLLFAHGKTVVCEVNVGPIGVYCEQTNVDVGRILGEYAMNKCDNMSSTRS